MTARLLRNTARSLILLVAANSPHSTSYAQGVPDSGPTPGSETEPNPRQNEWQYDQVTATIPRAQAPIASAAQAQIRVALHKAKQKAEQTLCNGRWTSPGLESHQRGSLIEQTAGREPSWLFQFFRHPRPIGCGEVSRAQFFREMSLHLPVWIELRPAGQKTAFRGGQAVAPRQDAVATRSSPPAF